MLTISGQKVGILLEELGMEYDAHCKFANLCLLCQCSP